MRFCAFRYISNEYRVQGLPVRFVGNTIMEGNCSDRVRFALSSTDRAFPVTETADTPLSTQRNH
ncbi:TPA: hypothetical protein MH590_26300 [Klebsiella pneumoniae]|nr:hypothetical protein [Klebsiella pneumoniae]HBX6001299.1 hypothetical protein [Klebsiella pneumoniae]